MSGDRAILIDASLAPESLAELGVTNIEAVLLTHHHRDTVAFASEYRAKKFSSRRKESAEFLTPENVAKFWKDSIPLRNSRCLPLCCRKVSKGSTTHARGLPQEFRFREVEHHALPVASRPAIRATTFVSLWNPEAMGKGRVMPLFAGDALRSHAANSGRHTPPTGTTGPTPD